MRDSGHSHYPVSSREGRVANLPSPPGRGAGGEGYKTTPPKSSLPPDLLRNARNLRKEQTDAESLLWGLLRNRRFAGKKFRRQHPLGRYILDFYCYEEKLAIELDGGQHNEEGLKCYDDLRTAYINEKGIRLIRFWNNDVLQKTEAVLEWLWEELHRSEPSPQPLSQGERG